jgi:hypothetical protein
VEVTDRLLLEPGPGRLLQQRRHRTLEDREVVLEEQRLLTVGEAQQA